MSETGGVRLTAEPDAPRSGGPPRRGRFLVRPRRSTIVLGVIALVSGVAFATVFAFLVTSLSDKGGQPPMRTTGIPKTVSTKLATMMQLSPVPVTKAPGFTLTDQAGHPISLASLHGHPVVLTFMDPHCTDICPIVSAEFVKAYHDLGPLASKVVFAAVNVNAYHARVQDMAKYTRAQALNTIPSWHFFTGPVPALKAVWRGYNIQVYAPNPNADVQHTSAVYFIDPQGRERYLASPEVDHTKSGTAYLPASQQIAWGHGIALIARRLAG